MAIIALLFGSVLGALSALTGWLFFALPLGTALMLYLVVAFGMGLLPLMALAMRGVAGMARMPARAQ